MTTQQKQVPERYKADYKRWAAFGPELGTQLLEELGAAESERDALRAQLVAMTERAETAEMVLARHGTDSINGLLEPIGRSVSITTGSYGGISREIIPTPPKEPKP